MTRRAAADSNIALLIDADNASPDTIDEVLLVLGELGTINIRRAYGNWAKASLKGWGNLTGTHSIVPMQQFDVVKGKSATDMRMTIDAMDLLYRGNVDGFGIMSSDSDFLPLAQRIRENGLRSLRFRHGQDPVGSRSLHALLRRRGLVEQRGSVEGSRRPTGRTARSTTSCSTCSAPPTRHRSATRKAIRRLSELGQRAKAVSSFATRNYGFNRLSDLIRSIPNFEVKTGGTAGCGSSACASRYRHWATLRNRPLPSPLPCQGFGGGRDEPTHSRNCTRNSGRRWTIPRS